MVVWVCAVCVVWVVWGAGRVWVCRRRLWSTPLVVGHLNHGHGGWVCFGVGVPLQVVVDASGVFTLQLGVDEIVTVSTVEMHRGDDSHANDGLPIVPASTAWPRGVEAGLTGLAVDAPMVGAIVTVDQQGVWEVGDIDSTLSNPSLATGGAVCAFTAHDHFDWPCLSCRLRAYTASPTVSSHSTANRTPTFEAACPHEAGMCCDALYRSTFLSSRRVKR